MPDDNWWARMFFNLESAAIWWRHPSVILQIELFVLEYLETFYCVQTKVKLTSKQICSDSFQNKITDKLLTYKPYL